MHACYGRPGVCPALGVRAGMPEGCTYLWTSCDEAGWEENLSGVRYVRGFAGADERRGVGARHASPLQSICGLKTPTAAATTAATPTTAATATTAAASASIFTRSGFVDVQRPTLQIGPVETLNGRLGFSLRGHFHKSESP